MKADMKCLVDGLTTKLEERLGENGRDGITHAMHFLFLSSWPQRIEDAGITPVPLRIECFFGLFCRTQVLEN